jgi:hypothetical protein
MLVGSFSIAMSLISQQDRQMVIEALEFYIYRMEQDNCNAAAIYAYNTLKNWIELEYYKHEPLEVRES